MPNNPNSCHVLEALLSLSLARGADAADALLFESASVNAGCRMGTPEGVERSESAGAGLRVWVGAKQAMVSSTNISPEALRELAERAVAMARAATDDADSTLAPSELLTREVPDLDLFDGEEPSAEHLMAQAKAAEEYALAVQGVSNSEGAEASYSATFITLATTSGFMRGYRSGVHSLSVSALAGEGTRMERDYDYSSVRHRADLRSAEAIGKSAGERAVKRLNPRKAATCEVPVVFDPRAGRALLSSFAGAVNGSAVARGTSFLKGKMGAQVFAPGIRIVDDPHRKRGLGSRPFDGEGVANRAMALVEDGALARWLLDVRSANKLKLASTGHAARGLSTPPSPSASNLYLEAGSASPAELMADIQSGFYVTETSGMGVNLITGDYSQGAAGYWIERGELAYPVAELTIAGHLSDMFAGLTPANDLEFSYATNVPTLRVARMTVAGA